MSTIEDLAKEADKLILEPVELDGEMVYMLPAHPNSIAVKILDATISIED